MNAVDYFLISYLAPEIFQTFKEPLKIKIVN